MNNPSPPPADWPDRCKAAHYLGWTDIQNLGPRASSGGKDEWVGIRPQSEILPCPNAWPCPEHPAVIPEVRYDRIPPFSSLGECEVLLDDIKRRGGRIAMWVGATDEGFPHPDSQATIADAQDNEYDAEAPALPDAIRAAYLAFCESEGQ